VFTPAPVAVPPPTARTSPLTALAGACLAGLLVSAGVLWLARPMPDEGRRPRLGSGVTASVVSPVVSTTTPVPLAVAASPLHRPQSTPTGLAVGATTPGRLGVEVSDADIDGDGVPDGALVVAVAAGGPADAAGIGPGDVISVVDQLVVDRAATLIDALSSTRPGQPVVLHLQRGAEADTADVVAVTLAG
jgi:S1-C subfamily serine protease